jgi:hypothetical protein
MKTKVREYTKGEIRDYAIKVLNLQGFDVWKENNLAVRGRAFIGRKGKSDVIGYKESGEDKGTFCVVEVKTLNDRFSDDQKDFLTRASKAGVYCFVAKQVGNEIVIEKYEV